MTRRTALFLTLAIIGVMVANSADFFFRRPYYEFWDLAANSLSVLRAKHFLELYGSYSRWGFHHPGPVTFYVQALGEWLFYDVLRLTPAPFNAQTLANLCVTTAFFVAALTVVSRWLSEPARRWFVPMALAVGAVHFGAVSRMPSYDMLLGSSVFTSAWTAHSWVMPFLCMLTAGASVAAGNGRDLPLLALADGFVIHAHIASPLFVGPVTLLAYGGLLCSTPGSIGWSLPGLAWRAFPRQHAMALGILTLFALPMVIDLFLGDASNFHAVMTHLRTHKGVHKSFARSLLYFVQFAAYRPYKPHQHIFTRFDQAGAFAYVWAHKRIYAAWILAILLVVWTSAIRPMLVRRGRLPDDDPRRTRFLTWAGAFLLLSIPLTLYWGIIQDGEMFYYSGWINFAITYFGLLILLAEGASVLAARAKPGWKWPERLVPWGALAVSCFLLAGRFRVSDPSPETNRVMHASNLRVVRDARARNPGGVKVFDTQFFAWPAATGLGLEMARQGLPFMVVNGLSAEHFSVPFGTSYAWRPSPPEASYTMELWRFRVGKFWKMWASAVPKWFGPRGKLLKNQLATARMDTVYPLLDGVELRIGVPLVSPEDGTALDLRKGGKAADCALHGFSPSESWGTWNEGTASAMRLRGAPVPNGDDVEIRFDAHPFLSPDAKIVSQRLDIAVNGTLLGPETLLTGDDAVTYTVPGALWNRTFGRNAGAALEFGFPDAVSPAAVNTDGNRDPRVLGVGFSGIEFRAVKAGRSSPVLDLDGPGGRAEVDLQPPGNASRFTSEGWSQPEAWGSWSRGHTGKMRFHSRLVEGTREVELTLDIHAVMETDSAIRGQRVRVSLGGIPVDYERTVERPGALVFTIPAGVWNAAVANDAEAILTLEFPDAVSPARIDPTGQERDGRLLAIGLERASFREIARPQTASR